MLVKERLFIMAIQCFIDWLCYVGVYVTVFSILCSLSSFFLFFRICLVAIIFLMNKDIYYSMRHYLPLHYKGLSHRDGLINPSSPTENTAPVPCRQSSFCRRDNNAQLDDRSVAFHRWHPETWYFRRDLSATCLHSSSGRSRDDRAAAPVGPWAFFRLNFTGTARSSNIVGIHLYSAITQRL